MSDSYYLHVKFGDNDFGRPVQQALEWVWTQINANNGHMSEVFGDRPVPEIFKELLDAGSLHVLVNRAIDLFYLLSAVEFRTRGLYWEKVDWKQAGEPFSDFDSLTTGTLLVEICSIENNLEFASEWQNGEEAYLDLNTGKTKTF